MSEVQVVQVQQRPGLIAGIIACVLGVLGILFMAFIFVPLGAIVALFGTIPAVKSMNMPSIGVNVLAWVLIFIGFATSPVLLGLIGIAASR